MTEEQAAAFYKWMLTTRSNLTAELYLGMVRGLLRAGADPLRPESAEKTILTFAGSKGNRKTAWGLYLLWLTGKKYHFDKREGPRNPNRVELLPDGTAKLWATNRKKEEIAAILVDQTDLPALRKHQWSLSYRGKKENPRIYVITQMNSAAIMRGAPRRTTFIHRFLLSPPPAMQVDHVNGDSLDNRRENLRVVTKQQQMQNQRVRRDNNTGHRNVTRMAGGQYRVLVTHGGQNFHSLHDSIEEAALAAAELRYKLYTHHNEEREGNFLGESRKGSIMERPGLAQAKGRATVFEGVKYPSFAALVRAKGCGVSAGVVQARVNSGWGLERALSVRLLSPGRPRKNFG